MIYRGELYYGPEHTTLFVVYGSYTNVGKALGMADEYIRMTKKYEHISISHNSLWRYWWWTITDPIRNIIAEIEAPDGCYNEDINFFQRIAYWWKYRRKHTH